MVSNRSRIRTGTEEAPASAGAPFLERGSHEDLGEVALIGLDDHECRAFVAEARWQRLEIAIAKRRSGPGAGSARDIEQRCTLETAEFVGPRSRTLDRRGPEAGTRPECEAQESLWHNSDAATDSPTAVRIITDSLRLVSGCSRGTITIHRRRLFFKLQHAAQPMPAIRRTIFREEIATADESSNKTPCRGRF